MVEVSGAVPGSTFGVYTVCAALQGSDPDFGPLVDGPIRSSQLHCWIAVTLADGRGGTPPGFQTEVCEPSLGYRAPVRGAHGQRCDGRRAPADGQLLIRSQWRGE